MRTSSARGTTATYALLAPVGAALFTLAWLVLGFLSPGYPLFDMEIEHYSPVSQPISGLGLGVTGPWMNTAFIVCGVLVGSGLFAASRTWSTGPRAGTGRTAAVLLTLSGVGIGICGIFTLEAVMPHLLGFLLAVGAPSLGFILAGAAIRHSDKWLSRVLLVAGPVTLTLLVAFLATFDPLAAADNQGIAGLIQRALVSTSLLASALVGYRAWAVFGSQAP